MLWADHWRAAGPGRFVSLDYGIIGLRNFESQMGTDMNPAKPSVQANYFVGFGIKMFWSS